MITFNYCDLYRSSPEYMMAFKEGYEAHKCESIEIINRAVKLIKELEAFKECTTTTTLEAQDDKS